MAETLRVKELKSVFTPEQIAVRVRELGVEIDGLYGQEPLVAICVLKGGVIFFSDLVRALHNQNLELDFVRLSSYGKSSASSKHVIFNKDVEVDIRGKHVLIVEDVVDSGHSMRFLLDQFAARQARSAPRPQGAAAHGSRAKPLSGVKGLGGNILVFFIDG